MYPKFKEISLDTATWTVAFLGAIEERETKSKKPFCTFHLLDGAIAITANLWNTEKKDIYKVQEKSVISVQLYKKLYNGVETYEVKEYQAAPDDAKLEDYLLTAPIPSQDMMDEIKSILSKEISETELYPLVMEILDENADKLLYWAATTEGYVAKILMDTKQWVCFFDQNTAEIVSQACNSGKTQIKMRVTPYRGGAKCLEIIE